MGSLNAERVKRRMNGFGIIVARGAGGRRVAVAITGIIERNRAALAAEMRELRVPHAFVGADAVEEDDRRRIAAPSLNISDAPPRGRYARHWLHHGVAQRHIAS